MKTILISLSVLFSSLAFGQISLEHTFSTNANLAYLSNGNRLWTFVGNQLTIYNNDYSVYRNISVPSEPGSTFTNVLLVSDKLIDSDNEIEYVTLNSMGGQEFRSFIYDENGQQLQNLGNTISAYTVKVGAIYKLLTVSYNTTTNPATTFSKVYSVNGEYPLFTESEKDKGYSNAYPNPAQFNMQIDYVLPQGENAAQIILMNQAGQIVRTWNVNGYNGKLLINSSEFSSGLYHYSIQTNGSVSSSGSLIFQ
jgi:hypothetical protein